jgi:hypothetical protein
MFGIVEKATLGIYFGIDANPELDCRLEFRGARKITGILRK